MMNKLKFHPAADSFPLMDGKRFMELCEDIKEHNQREPITIQDGMILDGRNRYNACIALGIEPITKSFAGDPWAYVWSLNGERRDLVAEQRYLIWKFCNENSEAWQAERERIAEEANRKRSEAMRGVPYAPKGEERKLEKVVGQSVLLPSPPKSEPGKQAKAAASQTNAGAVARGDRLAAERPDLAEHVRKGEMKPAEAHRAMKKDEVKEKVKELPTGKYRVLYADPPWSYNDKQAVKGEYGTGTGAADGHYPTMTLSELKALGVSGIAADDSVLFIWATCPLLEDALSLASAWGFKYKAQFVWDKIKHNMGHYNSVRHEVLLICIRGSCVPDNNKLYDSVQSIERTEHSRKPEVFREIIDALYYLGPRIELFARGVPPRNWEAWGNESMG